MSSAVKNLLLNMILRMVLGIALVTVAGGCDILRDAPFRVLQWSPGAGSHPEFTGPAIRLQLSHEADRYRVERSFSCNEDGLALSGTFSWEGRWLSFYPHGGIRANRDYRIGLSTEAQDKTGLSLEKAFEGFFSTRPEGSRMVLLETDPADGGLIGGLTTGPCFDPLRLTFSQVLRVENLYQYVSFSPTIQGLWELESEGRVARFTPSQAWQSGKNYLCTVGKDLPDSYDRPMGQTYRLHFSVGNDWEPPRLLALRALDREGHPVRDLNFIEYESDGGPGSSIPVNEHLERTYRLQLEFSEPVDPLTVKNRLSIQSGLSFTLSPPYPASTTFVLAFTDQAVYGTQYTLSVGRGITDAQGNPSTQQVLCSLLFNGQGSKPPRLVGIRLPLAPGGGAGNEEPRIYDMNTAFGDLPIENGVNRYPYEVPTDTWIELYFDLALGAHIDLFSLMNALTISATNGALTFAPRAVTNSGFTWLDPEPGWEAYERVEVRGLLTNGTNAGLVTVSLSADLADSLGNRAGNIQTLPLCK